MAKILDGIRIIDFSQGHEGSYATMMLADFGAEVIKIEDYTAGGDVLRNAFPKNDKGSAYHAYMNRGKKSVCIDRHSEKGQALIMKLIEKADVVVDCFPAGELEKCNLGYEDAKKVNKKIIYASQTGFGKTGPLSATAGNDLTAEALCGLMQITGHIGTDPTAHGSRMADQYGNVFLAFAIVGALMVAEETGECQVIDVSSTDCMFTALEDAEIEASMSGTMFEREGNKSRSIAPYDTFDCKDGIVSTAVSTNGQWAKFCKVMGLEDIQDDPKYRSNESRGENYEELREIIQAKFINMTKWEIEDLLRPDNIPSGPGLTVEEAFENEHIASRHMVLEVEDKAVGKLKMPGIPIKMSGIDDTDVSSAPLLGEDTRTLLEDAGVDAAEYDALAAAGVIQGEGGNR